MHGTKSFISAGGSRGLNVRFGVVSVLSAAFGLTLVACALQRWRKSRRETEGDKELFDDLTESPLFNPGVAFPAKLGMKVPLKDVDTFGDVGALSIKERERALQLARGLLQQLHGNQESKEVCAEESSDSEGTNVSLNYYIATEMEREARNSLVEAVIQGDILKLEAQGKSLKLSDCADVLVKVIEYFSISNDREKLRERRAAMHREKPRNLEFFGKDDGDHNDGVAHQMVAINEAYADYFSRAAEIDQRLSADKDINEVDERFEMNWEGDDDSGAEADLMAYLDQDDAAGYGSRIEARLGAMRGFNTRMGGVDGEMDFEDHDDDYLDEFEEEEDSDDVLEKTDFERMLISRLQQLSTAFRQNNTMEETVAHSRREGHEVHSQERQEEESEDVWETESDDNSDGKQDNE